MVSESAPAIQTKGLSKGYGSSVELALNSLDLTVDQGEIFGFLGPNGAGKTTTIRLLLDLIRPTSGKAMIFGLDCKQNSLQIRHKVGYLPGELSLYSSYNGHELIKLFISLRRKEISQDYVTYLTEKLDVDIDRPLGRLSHGNRQKIGLLLALMSRPDLLILDEPTTGLDPLIQYQALELLREAKSEGRTVFFSSHVLPSVEQICDKVGIIRRGRMIAMEPVQMLRDRRLQSIRINFDGLVPRSIFSSLTGVRIIESTDKTIHLEVKGEIDSVVKTAARYKVISIESEQPSLEEAFMTYYQTEPEGFEQEGDASVSRSS